MGSMWTECNHERREHSRSRRAFRDREQQITAGAYREKTPWAGGISIPAILPFWLFRGDLLLSDVAVFLPQPKYVSVLALCPRPPLHSLELHRLPRPPTTAVHHGPWFQDTAMASLVSTADFCSPGYPRLVVRGTLPRRNRGRRKLGDCTVINERIRHCL